MESDFLTDVVVITRDLARRFGLEEGQELIRKLSTAPVAKEAVKEEERSIVSVISTAGVDRDGDILRPDGLDDRAFRKHPIVLFGHRYHELPIGRNEWIKVQGRRVVAKTVYAPGDINPLAERVFRFRQQGFPLAQSIGFLATDSVWSGEDGFDGEFEELVGKGWVQADQKDLVRRIIRKWTLYEYSDVVVPANPEALTLAVSKGLVSRAEADLLGLEPDSGNKVITLPEAASSGNPVLTLRYLTERVRRTETRLEELERENEALKKDLQERDSEPLSGLERALPVLITAFQEQTRETSRELIRALARITGAVTLPD